MINNDVTVQSQLQSWNDDFLLMLHLCNRLILEPADLNFINFSRKS